MWNKRRAFMLRAPGVVVVGSGCVLQLKLAVGGGACQKGVLFGVAWRSVFQDQEEANGSGDGVELLM